MQSVNFLQGDRDRGRGQGPTVGRSRQRLSALAFLHWQSNSVLRKTKRRKAKDQDEAKDKRQGRALCLLACAGAKQTSVRTRLRR